VVPLVNLLHRFSLVLDPIRESRKIKADHVSPASLSIEIRLIRVLR
jgi:hypothetical protein